MLQFLRKDLFLWNLSRKDGDYVKEESFIQNTRLTRTEKHGVAKVADVLQVVAKYTFVHTDYLKLSIAAGQAYIGPDPIPLFWETDHTTAAVTYQNLEKTHAGAYFSYGMALQGRYFVSKKLALQASIGWQNHDISR